jgi:hypothetical protein
MIPILAIGLVQLILAIAVIGLIVWIITTYIPMPPIFKTVIYVICAIVAVLLLLRLLGIGDIDIGLRNL